MSTGIQDNRKNYGRFLIKFLGWMDIVLGTGKNWLSVERDNAAHIRQHGDGIIPTTDCSVNVAPAAQVCALLSAVLVSHVLNTVCYLLTSWPCRKRSRNMATHQSRLATTNFCFNSINLYHGHTVNSISCTLYCDMRVEIRSNSVLFACLLYRPTI